MRLNSNGHINLDESCTSISITTFSDNAHCCIACNDPDDYSDMENVIVAGLGNRFIINGSGDVCSDCSNR